METMQPPQTRPPHLINLQCGNFVLQRGIPVPPVKRGSPKGFAADLRAKCERLIREMAVGELFTVPEEKYARYCSDFAKTVSTDGSDIRFELKDERRVTFREIPGSGCQYAVWRVK